MGTGIVCINLGNIHFLPFSAQAARKAKTIYIHVKSNINHQHFCTSFVRPMLEGDDLIIYQSLGPDTKYGFLKM